jgi:large subunit ribosomal protein L21
MYAIIRSGGKQYRVREGDRIDVERIETPEGGDVTFDEVLLVGSEDNVAVGTPTVPGASVAGTVEAHVRAPKVQIFKYKNKTRSKVLRGHRQHLTRVAITGITSA